MSEQLRLIGWEAKGLRCPDYSIDLMEGGNPSPIALVQMPNGTGKTTSLEMLRAALSGEAEEWGQERIQSYRKESGDADRGFFEVSFQVGSDKVSIQLTLDFLEGEAEYKTIQNRGNKEGFHPPVGLRQFLDPEFVEFFVFDGELADRILDPNETDAQRAIDNLFQLHLFDTMEDRINEYWESESEDQRVKNKGVLRKHKKKRDRSKERLKKVRRKKEDDLKKLKNLKKDLKEKEDRFEDEIKKQEEYQNQLRRATEEYEQVKGQVESSVDEILEKIRAPYALLSSYAEEITTLKDSLDRVQLPEKTAREFFEELAEEDLCVCGRPIGNDEEEAIRSRSDQYLGSDDVAFLNAMKQDIEGVRESAGEAQDELDGMMHELLDLLDEKQQARNGVDRVKSKSAADSPQIKSVKDDIDQLKERIGDLEDKMERYENLDESKGIDDTWSIEVLEDRIERHERKMGEVADTLSLRKRKDVLSNIVKEASSLSREAISNKVCSDANDRIDQLMPNNNIRIEGLDKCLKLQNKEKGSAGETLTIGYAFLSTLFDRSDYQLPFIVDSPANPIDLEIREQIGSIVPKLSGQFIAFTISAERPGFVESLSQEAGSKIKFTTLFRKGIEDAEEKIENVPKEKIQESEDGWLVEGIDYFQSFQVDEDTR